VLQLQWQKVGPWAGGLARAFLASAVMLAESHARLRFPAEIITFPAYFAIFLAPNIASALKRWRAGRRATRRDSAAKYIDDPDAWPPAPDSRAHLD
jgi:hypothetical protein